MEPNQYLEHLQADGEALAAVARTAPEAHVETCPDWHMPDLVGHLARVHRWANQLVATRATEYQKGPDCQAEDFDGVMAWYDEGLDELLATLRGTDPDTEVWNWAERGRGRALFWVRRMAHETSVHRWDGEAATGAAQPITRDLAVDGIDEYLGFVTRWLARDPIAGFEGSLHLHATDGEGEWSMQLRPDGLDLVREHRKADAAIRAPAADLLLWLTNRVSADSPGFQVFGQTELIDLWSELKF